MRCTRLRCCFRSTDEIPKVFFPDSMQLSYGLGWFVQDYRGHQLIIHAGDIDGFATMVVLIPEIRTGYFAVINMGSLYRQVLSYQIADHLLHLPDAGWSERFKKMHVELQAQEKAGEAWQSKRVPGTRPSRDLPAYAGKYENPAYGDAEVGIENGKLVLHLPVRRLGSRTLSVRYFHREIPASNAADFQFGRRRKRIGICGGGNLVQTIRSGARQIDCGSVCLATSSAAADPTDCHRGL